MFSYRLEERDCLGLSSSPPQKKAGFNPNPHKDKD